MRLMAARATRIAPVTLRSMVARIVSGEAASSGLDLPVIPALLTRWVSRPSFVSISAKTRSISPSTAMSPLKVSQLTPSARQARATRSAASASRW
jgi:hypothetical protein